MIFFVTYLFALGEPVVSSPPPPASRYLWNVFRVEAFDAIWTKVTDHVKDTKYEGCVTTYLSR